MRFSSTLAVPVLLLTLGPGLAQKPDSPSPPDQATLERQLADRLTNSRFTGFYTIEGQAGPPQQDQYTLGKVEKGEGDKWLFNARLEYGKKVLTLPLEIPVLWAGDTPVISVTQFTIPGMGTYTARVMIYGEHYAGTWSSPRHGGYMWGRIEHVPENQAPKHSAEQSAPERNLSK